MVDLSFTGTDKTIGLEKTWKILHQANRFVKEKRGGGN